MQILQKKELVNKMKEEEKDENESNDSSNQKWRTRDLIKQKKFYIYLPMSITSSFVSTGLMFHQIFIFNQKGWSLIKLKSCARI